MARKIGLTSGAAEQPQSYRQHVFVVRTLFVIQASSSSAMEATIKSRIRSTIIADGFQLVQEMSQNIRLPLAHRHLLYIAILDHPPFPNPGPKFGLQNDLHRPANFELADSAPRGTF